MRVRAVLPLCLLLAPAAAAPAAGADHRPGVCIGLGWVSLAPGETKETQRGPDFDVHYFHGPAGPRDRAWGVYDGFAAQVRGNGPVLLQRDGVIVRRALVGGKFQGYLAEKGGRQNHFFGSVFKGSDADRAFFARVDFGSGGRARCAGSAN